jgi:alkanesulfonate monooxygenase SsuD/methylene tetrahydromethanopterin reductase-like flavin-dependent oxidoreductase (luciferase family)
MVDVYFFTEMPYAEFDEREAANYPSMRLTFPNTYFDPRKAHVLFRNYYDQYQWAEEVGFDGLMINEHHNTPSCMDVAVNMSAAVLGRTTHRAKILLLGNMLPTNDNPVRLAEEVAMADVISGGRIIAGVVRGIGIETWANNTQPNYNRERFEECHDLMLAAWTRPGPFRWEGKHYHFRVVNPWVLPIQKPHPPIWVPGTGSPETIEWAAQHRYTYAAFLVPLDASVRLYDTYREHAQRGRLRSHCRPFCLHGVLRLCRQRRESAGIGQALPVADGLSAAWAGRVLGPTGVRGTAQTRPARRRPQAWQKAYVCHDL